jgi:hypothetical protein
MIITESKPFGMIKAQLNKKDKIGIVSCNSCVRICETGGKEAMKELADRLKKEGFNVVDMDLIGMACDFDQLKKDELKGDITIALACDAGVYNLKKLFPNRKIVQALDTVGLGAYDEKGDLNLVKEFE